MVVGPNIFILDNWGKKSLFLHTTSEHAIKFPLVPPPFFSILFLKGLYLPGDKHCDFVLILIIASTWKTSHKFGFKGISESILSVLSIDGIASCRMSASLQLHHLSNLQPITECTMFIQPRSLLVSVIRRLCSVYFGWFSQLASAKASPQQLI